MLRIFPADMPYSTIYDWSLRAFLCIPSSCYVLIMLTQASRNVFQQLVLRIQCYIAVNLRMPAWISTATHKHLLPHNLRQNFLNMSYELLKTAGRAAELPTTSSTVTAVHHTSLSVHVQTIHILTADAWFVRGKHHTSMLHTAIICICPLAYGSRYHF